MIFTGILFTVASISLLTLFFAGDAEADWRARMATQASSEAVNRNLAEGRATEEKMQAERYSRELAALTQRIEEAKQIVLTSASSPLYLESVRLLQNTNQPGPWNIGAVSGQATGKSATFGDVQVGMQGGSPGAGPGSSDIVNAVMSLVEYRTPLLIGTAIGPTYSMKSPSQSGADYSQAVVTNQRTQAIAPISSPAGKSVIESVISSGAIPLMNVGSERGADYSNVIFLPSGSQYRVSDLPRNIGSISDIQSRLDLMYGTAQPTTQAGKLAYITEATAKNRADWYDITGIGDIETGVVTKDILYLQYFGGYAPTPLDESLRAGTASRQLTTRLSVLELQREAAVKSGDTRAASFYENEMRKTSQDIGALSSQYHYIGKVLDIPIPANPYEFSGDLAKEFVSGTPRKSSDVFSPVSGLMSVFLPEATVRRGRYGEGGEFAWGSYTGPVGLSDVQWQEAITGKSMEGITFLPAIAALRESTSLYGPYGELYGGPSYVGTPSSEGIRKQKESIVTTEDVGKLTEVLLTQSPGATGASAIVSPVGYTIEEKRTPFLVSAERYDIAYPLTDEERRNYERSVYGGYSGGVLGYLAFGTKSPEVIAGALGSVGDYITGMVGFTPVADTMRKTDVGYSQFKTERESVEKTVSSLEDYGKKTFGVNEKGQIKIDVTNPEALKFQEQYTTATTKYSELLSTGIEKGYLERKSTGIVESPDMFTYDYGEFTKWGIGAGKVIREITGIPKESLDIYSPVVEKLPGVSGVYTRTFGFGPLYTASTHPERIVTGAGVGAVFIAGGEVLGAVAEIPSVSARTAAFALQYPRVAELSKIALPTFFTGSTYYSASEGLTATPERTQLNIGKMLPELAGMVGGGGLAYGGLRAADTGYIGFGTREIRPERPGDIKPTVQYIGSNPEVILPENIPSKTTLSSLQGYIQRTQGYPAKTLQQIEIERGRAASSFEEFVAKPTEVEPLLQASATSKGLPTFKEQVTVAEFNRIGGLEVNIYGQPRSIRTELFAESKLPISIVESETIAKALGLRVEELPKPSGVGLSESRSIASEVGLRIEPLESPKGIETRFSGAPISQQMLEQLTNREIASGVARSSYTNIDVAIKESSSLSRIKPILSTVEEQRILPRLSGEVVYGKRATLSASEFEDKLNSILESSKRNAVPEYKTKETSGVAREGVVIQDRFVIESIAISTGERVESRIGGGMRSINVASNTISEIAGDAIKNVQNQQKGSLSLEAIEIVSPSREKAVAVYGRLLGITPEQPVEQRSRDLIVIPPVLFPPDTKPVKPVPPDIPLIPVIFPSLSSGGGYASGLPIGRRKAQMEVFYVGPRVKIPAVKKTYTKRKRR